MKFVTDNGYSVDELGAHAQNIGIDINKGTYDLKTFVRLVKSADVDVDVVKTLAFALKYSTADQIVEALKGAPPPGFQVPVPVMVSF